MSKQNSVLRMLSIIVVFAMLFCVVPVSANESIAYTLEVGSVSVDMDKTDATDGYYNVSVPIELTKNAGLISITAEVTYDEAITLTGWSEGEIFPISEGDVSEYNISSALSTDLAKNPYKIMYVASTVATQFYSTGTLMSLNFKVPYSVRSLDYPISVKVTSLITQDDSQETKPASEVSELASVVSGKISMKTEGSGVIPVALYKAEDINVVIDKSKADRFLEGTSELMDVTDKYSYQHLLPGNTPTTFDAVRYELKVTNTTLKLSDARYVKIGYRTNSNNNTPQVGVWINNGTKDIRVYDKAFATFEKNDLWGETIYDLQQNYTGSSDSSIVLSGDASADWTSLKDNFFKGVCLRAYGANNSVIAEGSYFDVAYIALFNSAEEAQKYTYFKTASVEFKDGDTILATKNLVVGDRLVYPEEPEVAGKVFAGWDTQEGTLLLGDTVVNAVFKEDVKVNVKINAQNGTFTINDGEAISSYDEAVGAGETLELVATPATGYKFDGWYDVTGESDELITEESEYSLFVKAACELEARFVDVNAPEAPVAVFDLYANKETKKHVVNYSKFSTNIYSQEDNAFKFTGKGSHNGKDMGFSPDNVDFSDAGNAARKALIDSEADIGYLVITYRNPQGMSSIKRRYIDNSNKDIKEDVALLNSGDDYYSVIIDVSGQRLWFRDYYDRSNVSNIALYPFSSLASDDTNSYDLYFRSIALTRDLKDAYGYCKSLVTAGDSAGYHLNGGDLITDEVEIEEFDLKISAQNGTFTVNGGEASTLVEGKYEKDSKLTLVATAAENYEFIGWYDVTGENDELITEEATYELTVSAALEIEARFAEVEEESYIAIFPLYSATHLISDITVGGSRNANLKAYVIENKTGAINAGTFGITPNKNNPTTDTEAKTAVESFVSQANHASEPITYMILTYKNPDGISKMHHQYRVNNGTTGNPVNREIFIQNTGDKYYSVIVDVSGKTLLFRNYIDRAYTSHVAIQPFAGVDGEDTKQYDLYLREAAFVTSLEDAKAYCEGLITAGDSSLYHMNGEGVPETEVRITLDKHAYRMNAGDKLTIGVDTDEEATITYESSNTNVATVENGVITAVTNGETEITVTATKGELVGTDKIKIYVIDEISPITVDKKADAPVAPAVMPKITFLGDSITAGSQTSKTYHSYLADRLYITAVNKGLSGSNIAGVGSSNQASFIDRVSQIPDDTDLIFVMGGTNDFGQNAGTLDRFVPGIRTLIEELIKKAPSTPIVFSTPLQNGGYFSITTNKAGETLAQYVAEIEKACAEYGIPVIKAYRNAAFKDFCTWDGDTVTGYNKTYYADGVHPNEAGHKIMADFFEAELEKAGVVNYVKYTTTNVTAIGGGTVAVDNGEAAESISATVVTGTNITLTATAKAGYKLEGWYDITNGKNVLLSRETSFVYTANKDAKIEARFMDETISIAVKLVASTSEGGFISINGNPEDDVNDYVNGSSTQELTAVPEEGYVFAYWKRVSCQSGTEIFMSTDATLNAAPLGNAVYYMPVFVPEGTTLNLYLDAQELILGTEEPEIPSRLGYSASEWKLVSDGDIVDTYKPFYTRVDADTVLTIVYADSTTEEVSFKYDDQIIIIGTLDNPVWTLTANGEETIISYSKEFNFGAAFTSNITLTETANDNGATANVSGVESVYDSGAKLIKFVAMFTLPEGATLNERGVLLTNDADIAEDMELNTPNIIVGRVNSNPETATKTFIINKTKVNAGDTWYGRPYIVYTEGGVTKTLYATTMEGMAK